MAAGLKFERSLACGSDKEKKSQHGKGVKWMEFGKETRPRAQTWADRE